MAYLPSRWDSGDEATGPHMDETLTVKTSATRDVAPRAGDRRAERRSVRRREGPPGRRRLPDRRLRARVGALPVRSRIAQNNLLGAVR